MPILIETPESATEAVVDFITAEEYLQRERSLPRWGKHEFINGKITKMGGAGEKHNTIQTNLIFELKSHVRGKGFRVYGSDMRVNNPLTGSYTYPDISVVRGKPLLKDQAFDNLLNPCLITEVLSPGTKEYDREDKFTAYQNILTLQEYILVDTKEIQVEYFRKIAANQWQKTLFTNPADTLVLLDGAATVQVSDLYKDTDLEISTE